MGKQKKLSEVLAKPLRFKMGFTGFDQPLNLEKNPPEIVLASDDPTFFKKWMDYKKKRKELMEYVGYKE